VPKAREWSRRRQRGMGPGRGYPLAGGILLPSEGEVWEGSVPVPRKIVKIVIFRLKIRFYALWGMFLECKRHKKHRLKPFADTPLHALASRPYIGPKPNV